MTASVSTGRCRGWWSVSRHIMQGYKTWCVPALVVATVSFPTGALSGCDHLPKTCVSQGETGIDWSTNITPPLKTTHWLWGATNLLPRATLAGWLLSWLDGPQQSRARATPKLQQSGARRQQAKQERHSNTAKQSKTKVAQQHSSSAKRSTSEAAQQSGTAAQQSGARARLRSSEEQQRRARARARAIATAKAVERKVASYSARNLK
jgi:hypothetical protein